MAQDLELNKLLHKIWDIDEKIEKGETLNQAEKDLYNQNISTIQNYYTTKSDYWNNRKPV